MRRPASLARFRAVVGLGIAQLRRSPGRTALAVCGVVLAVLSVTLLASLGVGVVETGQQQFDDAGRDIWITGGPAAGGENEVVDAAAVASDLREREDVGDVSTVALHDVYVGAEPDAVEPITAVGVEGTHAHFEFEDGEGFDGALTADGEAVETPSDVVVLDPETADRFDVDVGDTVYVGAGRRAVDAYTVAGIGSYYSRFLGTETATVPLPELQSMTGTAGADRASFVTVNLEDGADRGAVADDVRAAYPSYDVRTADDQFAAMLTDRSLVVAGGIALVGLAVVGGVALTANLFALVAYQQRDTLAALRAVGLSRGLLAGTIGVQGAIVGLLGGAIGVAATPALAAGLNALAARLVGFERLVRTPLEVSALGFAVAVVVGTLVAVVAGWRASRSATLEALEA
ncbi:ABC transporter permease [Natronococcus jeotgali]|uniref:ABC transporter permease n=1 Tax=Natronococcus jeotgali DSM 18795 TaxID=1227498 RepID=L9X1U6_9EURY|nr:ABC transporter permease [Natronococcus jeotgali]ELY55749.1 hypothetical protein C492_15781 [Natronococcus jeotgali DSM 18795]